jgi:hypothetical protein
MTPSQIKTSLLAATLCAALTACGGSDDDSSTPSTTTAASAFADCFDVTAGVAFTMTDADVGGTSDGVLMLKESFEGVVRNASVELQNDTTVRGAATYWSRESNGIRFWGFLDYDSTGTVETKTLHSDGFVLPLSMQAGQSAALSYTDTYSYLSGDQAGQTETAPQQSTWTFEGFETLTLGGKVFTDVCRMRTSVAQPAEDGPSTVWFAKGFGIIRAQHTDSAGVIVDESHLETITAQP